MYIGINGRYIWRTGYLMQYQCSR